MNEKKTEPGQTAAGDISPPLDQLMADIAAGMTQPGPEPVPGREPKADDSENRGNPFIRFIMDGVHFAVPLHTALEVSMLPVITPLPNLPAWVSGISNIRGEIVSIVDMKNFMGRSPSTEKSGKNVIVLRWGEMKVGFKVDGLMGIIQLSEALLEQSANPFTQGAISRYLTGVVPAQGALLHLLDVEKLMTSEKLNAFQRK